MDGDVLTQFRQDLEALAGIEELPTLMAMRDLLDVTMSQVQFELMLAWFAHGYRPNPPGLCCHLCGGMTYGRQVDHLEYVRCVSLTCGVQRTIQV